MENTNNLNLKKPDYTDFADIFDINDNMDTIDEKLHDTKDSVVAFTSSDVADGGASSWTNVTKVASGEKHSSLFAKMSQMFKNIRYLYKLLGTTDISSIGDGTVTKALSVLNANFRRTWQIEIAGGGVIEKNAMTCTLQFNVALFDPQGACVPEGYRPKFENGVWAVVAVTNDYANTYVMHILQNGYVEIQKNGIKVTAPLAGVRGHAVWDV